MKRVLSAIVLAAAGYLTWASLRLDDCLDSGGMWAGPMGCQTVLRKVDRLLIDKSERKLWAFEKGREVAQMEVALGASPIGNKVAEGDDRTPEGIYPITSHKFDSAYHRALRLGYPTPQQTVLARSQGRDPGGDIMIHGLRNGLGWIGRLHLLRDWTRGCVAVTNGEIDWLYQSVPDGTPVEIRT